MWPLDGPRSNAGLLSTPLESNVLLVPHRILFHLLHCIHPDYSTWHKLKVRTSTKVSRNDLICQVEWLKGTWRLYLSPQTHCSLVLFCYHLHTQHKSHQAFTTMCCCSGLTNSPASRPGSHLPPTPPGGTRRGGTVHDTEGKTLTPSLSGVEQRQNCVMWILTGYEDQLILMRSCCSPHYIRALLLSLLWSSRPVLIYWFILVTF